MSLMIALKLPRWRDLVARVALFNGGSILTFAFGLIYPGQQFQFFFGLTNGEVYDQHAKCKFGVHLLFFGHKFSKYWGLTNFGEANV